MAACDVCKIVYACTVTDESGEQTTPNSNMFNQLAACQYSGPCEYSKAFQAIEDNKKVTEWLKLWNQGDLSQDEVKEKLEACKNRDEAANLYFTLIKGNYLEIQAVNEYILKRWSLSGLKYVKEQAWKQVHDTAQIEIVVPAHR